MDREEVISLVRAALDRASARIRFEILEAGVRQDGAWWYVPVFAEDRGGELLPRDFVVSTYANVEEALKESSELNVLFIPFIPERSESKITPITS